MLSAYFYKSSKEIKLSCEWTLSCSKTLYSASVYITKPTKSDTKFIFYYLIFLNFSLYVRNFFTIILLHLLFLLSF